MMKNREADDIYDTGTVCCNFTGKKLHADTSALRALGVKLCKMASLRTEDPFGIVKESKKKSQQEYIYQSTHLLTFVSLTPTEKARFVGRGKKCIYVLVYYAV